MKKIILVCLFVLSAIFYAGCKKTSIQFHRESGVSKVLKSIPQNNEKKDAIKKSSGIIIYKDNSSNEKNRNYKNPHFGPKDLDFDIKIK